MKLSNWLQRLASDPKVVIPIVGVLGFLMDYLWRPISWVGIILCGFIVAPWLLQIIAKLKVGGLELEFIPATVREREENIEREVREAGEIPISTSARGYKTKDMGRLRDSLEQREMELRTIKATFREDEAFVLSQVASAFAYPVRQQVRFGPFFIDGIIDRPRWKTLVEVKLLYSEKRSFSIIDNAISQLSKMRDFYARPAEASRIDGLLAIGVPAGSPIRAKIEEKIASLHTSPETIRIEIYDLPDINGR